MKTKLLKLAHGSSLFFTALVLAIAFFVALLRAEAPAIESESPRITQFLSDHMGHPVHIESIRLRWRHFLPVLALKNIHIEGSNPIQIGQIKLGTHFILFKKFSADLSKFSDWNDSSSYFRHIILEEADIKYQQYEFKIDKMVLHKKLNNSWSWDGDNISLGFGKLFLKPIIVEETQGTIWATQQDDEWKISAEDIKAQNADALVVAKAELTIPNNIPSNKKDNLKDTKNKTEKNNSHIDLKARYEINSSAVANLKNYLPVTLMDKDLFQWLTHSVKSLESCEGVFILKGKLADFPFDKRDSLNNPSGEFLVNSHLVNTKLEYDKNWPAADNMNAELIFENTKMLAHVHSVELAHSTLKNIEIEIPELEANGVLNISGSMSLPVQNAIYFLHNSPLQKTLGKRFDDLRWTGPMDLDLKLRIPLGAKSPNLKVLGNINLNNTVLSLPSWKMNLNNFTGMINFTENNFSSEKLTAQYNNAPVTIKIDPIEGYRISYKNFLAIIKTLKNNSMQVDISHPAWKGRFFVADNFQTKGIKGVIYFLNLDQNIADKSMMQEEVKPSGLPPLDIKIMNINYKKFKFNSLYLQTDSLSNGLWIRRLQLNGPGYSVAGQGKWLDNKLANISGKLVSNDLAKMVSSWGLEPSLQGNNGQMNFNISWPGVIYSPDFSHLAGKIELNIYKGQILTTGSQAKMDFGRLITLLSFQSLQRRLTLDFSDLTKKGFSFDSITGFVILDNHGAATLNNLILKSAVASINLIGNIDLIRKTYNLTAKVTPHLTSSLPLVATIAGGPIAGAAVWAASNVVNPILDKVTEDDYSVTGPWTNPVIKKEQHARV